MEVSTKRLDVFGRLAKRGGHGIPIAAIGVLAAIALGASAVHSAAGSAPGFTVIASPTHRSVVSGSTTRYRISIRRRSFRGRIMLSVKGAPRYARSRLTAAKGSGRALTVTTSPRTPAGRYRLVVRGRTRGLTKTLRLLLVVTAPKPVAVGITGAVSGLQPGMATSLDLVLRNPSVLKLSVTGLTVAANGLSAPSASPLLPCTLADFSLRQFSGPYPLVVPPSATRTLSSLGVPAAQRPQVMLLNRPLDQDGCQGAVVSLALSAQGTGS
jgi:hypothetical protein